MEKREVWLLGITSMIGLLFTFTLGIHYGKKVGSPVSSHGSHGSQHADGNHDPVDHSGMVADKVPSKIEFSEQARGAKEVGDLSLAEALEHEVSRTGIRLDSPRQVDLPTETKSPNAGATTPKARLAKEPKGSPAHAKAPIPHETPAPTVPSADGIKFALQIGSFPVMKEARERIAALRAEGLTASMKSVELDGRGTWYRVYVGDFSSKNQAEEEGKRLKAKKLIEGYVISNLTSH